jgi:thiazole/oxazole-forming peptide maturase SagD family component
MRADEAEHCISGSWLLEADTAAVSLLRPSDGSRIELEDLDPAAFAALWLGLQQPCEARTLVELFRPFGAEADDLRGLLLEHDVIRQRGSGSGFDVQGDLSPLLALVKRTAQRLGLSLPALHCLRLEAVLAGKQAALWPEIFIVPIADCLVIGNATCPQCAALRTLGAIGRAGEEQTHIASIEAEPPWREAMVVGALCELTTQALESGLVLLARPEHGFERGRALPHPDCRRCGGTRARRASLESLRQELSYDEAPPTSAAAIEAVFGGSPLAPIVMTESVGPPGTFPFDLPFMAGHTRLTRRAGERLFCTSIAAIAHGSAPTATHTRLLAWSEGVERIAAQSVAPDRHEGGEPYCEAWDLIGEKPRLVPSALVSVATPNATGMILEPTFTGASSHTSYVAGILHATVEVLKREAFMIAWYRKRRLRALAWPEHLAEPAAERARYLASYGLVLEAFDLRSDLGLPQLLLCVRASRRVGNWPAGGVQLFPAGGFSAEEALAHGLGLACTRFAGIGLEAAPEKDPLDARAVAALAHEIPAWPAMVRYLDPARSSELDWLFSSESVEFTEVAPFAGPGLRERFLAMRAALADAGLSWLCVPLTTEDVSACGLRVVKVLLPEVVRFVLRPDLVEREQARLRRHWPGTLADSWNDLPHPLY